MFAFFAIKKLIMSFVLAAAVGGGVMIVDGLSWVREEQDGFIFVKKMSGSTWIDQYQYDSQNRLLFHRYMDNECRSHVISYDPETGEEIDHDTY